MRTKPGGVRNTSFHCQAADNDSLTLALVTRRNASPEDPNVTAVHFDAADALNGLVEFKSNEVRTTRLEL